MAVENTLQVGETILAQLGAGRFVAMTGAKNFVADDRSLMFSIGRGAKYGANKVRISLGRNDLYHVETFKIRGADFSVCNNAANVPAENLRSTFTRLTGFDVSL